MRSLPDVARATGISCTSLSRLGQAGVIAPDCKGRYKLVGTIQTLLRHYRRRERWAFMMLRRYRLFDERVDVLELPGDR
jgi:hypothetical protein